MSKTEVAPFRVIVVWATSLTVSALPSVPLMCTRNVEVVTNLVPLPESVDAWSTWMASWFAAFWTPADVPALHVALRLFDQVARGEFTRATELRLWSDTLGITPKVSRTGGGVPR